VRKGKGGDETGDESCLPVLDPRLRNFLANLKTAVTRGIFLKKVIESGQNRGSLS
jgi:hypothetical protein